MGDDDSGKKSFRLRVFKSNDEHEPQILPSEKSSVDQILVRGDEWDPFLRACSDLKFSQ